MTAKPPITGPMPTGLRQRQRANGSWSLWWEPSRARRDAGMTRVDLDPMKPTAALREVEKLNRMADRRLGKAKPTTRRVMDKPRSIDDIAQAWLHSPRVQKLSAASVKNYRYDVTRIRDQWAGQAARNLTRPAIVLWYDALYEETGPRMAQRLTRTLGTMLSWAAKRGFVDINPATNLDMESPEARGRILSWTEFDALLDAATELDLPWMRHALQLAMFQGQRPKDIRELRFGQLSLAVMDQAADPIPRLTWTLVRSKDRKQRTTQLAINQSVVAWLMPLWRAAEDPDQLVIADQKGRAITSSRLSHNFDAVRRTAARRCPSVIDARFSDLRRTFSSVAYRNGIDPANVSDALGNTAGEDPGLRQVYMPASDQAAARAVDAVKRPEEKNET